MITEYIISDASVKFMDARNILEERLLYTGTTWRRGLDTAFKYPDSTEAVNIAKELNKELPVKVLLLQRQGNTINVGEVNF